ncbi:Uncharacterised protein [Propionibacterium australiense]|uniref:Uncharacterized protein n=1 Tax=Propionibacterium australiense TaxID=119981 RepID=A0A383S6E1_9ACTN|nr:Hypothetical protein PROPAUS_1322 [Propionibacterium australiense]VEH89693.1 Uncharacterised protein [Propionibacterium australiense]
MRAATVTVISPRNTLNTVGVSVSRPSTGDRPMVTPTRSQKPITPPQPTRYEARRGTVSRAVLSDIIG